MAGLLPDLDFASLMPHAPFSERHERTVAAPIDRTWDACRSVTVGEIRTLGPLFALRGLPQRLRGERPPTPSAPLSLLDAFVAEGFVLLRCDNEPRGGRATLIFGAAGRFWSPAHNAPRAFSSAQEFVDFDQHGFAKTVARVDAIDLGSGTAQIETETLIVGNDPASTRKFAPYWAVIRLPSGLIRRSWLAAIDRRATMAGGPSQVGR